MKKRWKIIAGILCITLMGTACSKKTINDGEEQQTTVDKTGKEENENQSKLDVLRPIAYSNVENLNLEPGSYISIIGRNSNDSYWNEVKEGAERAVADINSMLGYKGDDKVRLNYSGPSESDDVDEQVNILDEELARYPVAVGISVVDATACEVQFDLAAENDIPIVAFDSGSEYQDGAQGSAFIVTDVSDSVPEVKQLITDMVIAVVFILMFTALFLILWIYRGIVIPLGRMKIATQNIKDGNLDFELEIEADDEIGQLCRDFEEMRKRLKDTAEEKVEYDRKSKELISNISHDLKTPITAIKGYVEGIMDGVADTPEKMDRYIKTIYNKANEMDLLINELTLYSKIDSNRIPYNFSTVLVNDYFDDCAEDLAMELEARGIEFGYFNYVESDVKIIADVEQLKRVINNIVSNSEKYMDKEHGKINLRVKDVGDFVQIELEDNGKGIGAKELPHIFDLFYRTDASRNSSKGGSGIGLSIVKKIVEEHGGKIWATSKEGTGTVMYFVIRKYQEVPVNE